MAIYTQKTSKGQLLSASVVALASGQYEVKVRGIEPFFEADQTFNFQDTATKHAQAMLDEYSWRLEEMYMCDDKAAAQESTPATTGHETFFSETYETIDGEKIQSRVSWDAGQREWVIEVLANGMALVNETDRCETKVYAATTADDMARGYVNRVFTERRWKVAAPEPVIDPFADLRWSHRETTNNPDVARKNARIERLKAQIASAERELADRRFELEQLLSDL